MIKGYELAFPTTHQSGLTKRELIAAMVLAGSLGGRRASAAADLQREDAATAVEYADALIAELNKEKES